MKGDCGFGVVRGGALNHLNQVVSLDGPATYISACSGTGFSIQMPATINQIPRRWVTGDPALVNNNPRYDLVGFFANELGHALGINHPTQAAAVMSNNTKRELFQLDTECAELYVNSNRALDLRQAFFWNGSVSYSTLATDIWSTGPGVSAGGGNFLPNQFRGVQMKASGLFAERYSGGLLTLNSATYHTAEPATRLHRRELHQNYRDAIIAQKRQTVFYGDQQNERFRHRTYMSNDGFDSLSFHTDLRYCNTPSGSTLLSVCSASAIIRWYSSTTGDTDTWQLETSTGFTANGASGIGDWTVSNYLRWGE